MLWYHCETESRHLEHDGIDVVIVALLHKECKQLNENQAVDYHLHPGSSFSPWLGPAAADILAEAASQASSSQQMPLLAASPLFISHPSAQQHPGDTEPLLSHIQRAKNTSLEAYV